MAEDFQKILETEYDHIINKILVEILSKRSRQKKLNFRDHITKFNRYLEKKRTSNMKILQNEFKAWKSLAETTLK